MGGSGGDIMDGGPVNLSRHRRSYRSTASFRTREARSTYESVCPLVLRGLARCCDGHQTTYRDDALGRDGEGEVQWYAFRLHSERLPLGQRASGVAL